MPWTRGAPRRRAAGSGPRPRRGRRRSASPPAQAGQAPQARIRVTSTRSPGARPRDAGAERGDPAGGLVAVDRRQRAAPGALGIGDVGVADGAGVDRHCDLAGAGRGERDVLDAERFAEGPADGGAHALTSRCRQLARRAGYRQCRCAALPSRVAGAIVAGCRSRRSSPCAPSPSPRLVALLARLAVAFAQEQAGLTLAQVEAEVPDHERRCTS